MPPSKKRAKKKRFTSQIRKALTIGPLSEKDLLKKLQVPNLLQKQFYTDLKKLMREEKIQFIHKKLSLPKKKITGKLSVHPRGFGFVLPRNKEELSKDVFIPKKYMAGATDGDLVEVEVDEPPSKKGYEGKISQVLKRNKKNLVGTVYFKEKGAYVLNIPSLKDKRKVLVEETNLSLKKGDRIVVKVEKWGKVNEPTIGSFVKKLGHISDPASDIVVAMEEYQIPSDFPPQVLQETTVFSTEVTLKDQENRIDYTELPTVTIDPETAKDFDDALSLVVDTKKKQYHLYVHIADVSHYVKAGSFLDLEAYERANSVYFPGACIPMLPEVLSNGLCSLKPNVVRCVATVKMTFSDTGELIDYDIHRGFIKSHKRFSYEEAFSVLQKKEKSPFYPLLNDFVTLCKLLKQKRFERGSIDFALPDAQVVVDSKGAPIKIQVHEYDITHQLVEEFMLKANEVVAKALADKGLSLIYRIHEEPSLENFEEFFQTARILGFILPEKPELKDFQKLFIEAKKTPYFHRLSVAFIRSMKLAFYSPDNVGHYGLALTYYTHFTSPIRRYSDLIISRLLFDENMDSDLIKVSNQCSEKERNAMKAEQSVVYLKKLRLLKKTKEENPKRTYLATITKVKPSLLIFEIHDFFLESALTLSDIGSDFFEHDPSQGKWIGRRTNLTFSYGDVIELSIQEIDLIQLETKFLFLQKKESKDPSVL